MKPFNPDLLQGNSSIRLRSLKALGLASILAPTIIFAAYAMISYDAAFRAAEARAVHLSTILQDHAQRVFETIALALSNADQRLTELDDETLRTSRPLWEDIRRIQAAGPQLGSIFVIAPDGSTTLTTRAYPAPTVNFSDRDYFLAHKDHDAGFFLGRAYTGKISQIPIFNFSIRRSSKDSRFQGVIGISAFVKYFHDFYATVGDSKDEFTVLLLRSDGEILARYPDFNVGDKFDPQMLRAEAEPSNRVTYTVSPVDGRPRLYASAKIGAFPAIVAYSVTRDAVLRRWAHSLVIPGGIALAISVVLLLLSSFALRRARSEGIAIQHLNKAATSLNQEIERRERAEAALLQSQKLDAVGRLTGGIAHDFNNLLTIISGNLALAQQRDDVSKMRRLLKAAQAAAERGADLTRQLLAFSRSQNLHPVAVDLNKVLAEAKTWMARAVTEAIEIKFIQDTALWPIRVDVAQFEAALLNLVVNARDAMDGHGTLTVIACNAVFGESDSGRPVSLPPGQYVAVTVSDDGSGMPPDVVAKVFDPFFTTKDVGKGSGLGLSQVHGFIKQSGGEILIESEVGRGTHVTLYLPRSDTDSIATAAQPEASPPADREQADQVVLVVEDDDEVRMVSITLLHELGYTPIAARSAREALGILSADERVDILFTDVVLARGLDGVGLAKRAVELRPEITVLLTTASLEFTSSYVILPKPFTKNALAKTLQALAEKG